MWYNRRKFLCKKAALKILLENTCYSSYLEHAALLNKELLHWCFLNNLVKMSRTVQNILQNNCKDYHAVPDDSFIWTAKWLMCFHSSSLTTFKVLAVYLFSCYIWSRSHWRCSAYKKIFSKISQNSQESICVAGWRPAALLKKKLRRRCFPVTFVKFF